MKWEENDVEEPKENSKTDYIIDPINPSDDSIAFGLHSKLTSYENHYNIIQNKYKGLAVTWFLATFLAIGYVLSGFEENLPISMVLIISFLCMIAAIGIFLLWYIDSGIYFRMIEAIFNEIILIEDSFPVTGQSHHNMIKLHGLEHEPERFQGIFYSYIIFSFLAIASSSFGLYLYIINKWLVMIVIAIFLVAFVFFYLSHVHPLIFNEHDKKIKKKK